MFYSFTSYGLNKRLSIFTMVVDTTRTTHNTIKVGWINDGESPKISCHIKKCGILLPMGVLRDAPFEFIGLFTDADYWDSLP